MCAKRPDVTDEDLGIRAWRIQQAKAVERAMQLIRHGLGNQWSTLSESEIEEIEWLLGEMWSFLSRHEWDGVHFGHLTIRDLVKMLTLGSQLRRHARPGVEILREVYEIVDQYE